MGFLADAGLFMVLPWLVWQALRQTIPLAVTPVCVGILIKLSGWQVAALGVPSLLGTRLGLAGVLLLAFLAGVETRHPSLAGTFKVAPGRLLGSAALALAAPFAVGSVLAYRHFLLLPGWAPAQARPELSAMALGLCMSVSALPVLIGIVRELDPPQLAVGRIALLVATVDDAALWIGLLALNLAAGQAPAPLGWRAGLALVVLVAPVALARHAAPPLGLVLLAGLCLLAAGATASAALGLQPLIGAFAAGAALPRRWGGMLPVERLGRLALFAMAPFFFGHSALGIAGASLGWGCAQAAAGLLLICVGTKLGAVMLLPPATGFTWRQSLAAGWLLQCKGVMQIVAAAILRQTGLISDPAYAALILVALVSTAVTLPLFNLTTAWEARRNPLLAVKKE